MEQQLPCRHWNGVEQSAREMKLERKVREMATWHEEPVKEKCLEEIVCSILWTHLRYI
jgi:hypothetical protein